VRGGAYVLAEAVKKNPKSRPNTGSASAIYRVFLENEGSIKGLLRRFLYKQEDIDEIAQETFLRAYATTLGRQIDSPKAYIFRVARNLAYDELSRKTRKLTDYLEEAAKGCESTSATLEDEVIGHQQIQLYFDAIAELPPQCRKVFLMRKVQALPHKVIAKKLGITTSAVEKHIARGAIGCKQYLENCTKSIGCDELSSSKNTANEAALQGKNHV
jgi:RNA polymerase sigma-70 factor (ECF subfamily)